DAQRIFVVPDGTLNLVPLAALPTARGRYLIESVPVIHYLSAERDLVTDESPTVNVGSGLLAVGGPAFDDASSFRAALKSKPTLGTSSPQAHSTGSLDTATAPRSETLVSQSTTLRSTPLNCLSFRSMEFKALPASRIEPANVTSLWQRFGFEGAVTSQA